MSGEEGKAVWDRKVKMIFNGNKSDYLMGSLHGQLMRLVSQGTQC